MAKESTEIAPASELVANGTGALEQVERASIDVQITTAHKFPRNLQRSLTRSREWALMDADSAAECYYALPREGKTIFGPSIRLAEIIAANWGNLRVASRIMSIDKYTLTVAAVCHDLENNVAMSSEVRRRIQKKNGERYSEDMITVTSNAASAIAIRNAVFKVVPRALWAGILEDCMNFKTGASTKPGALEAGRQRAMDYFAGIGVTVEQILRVLDVADVTKIGMEELKKLKGIKTAIEEGTTTAEETFGPSGPQAPSVKTSKPLSMGDDASQEPGSEG